MQAPGSRIPPLRAAVVTDDLYKPCACLREYYPTNRPGKASPISLLFQIGRASGPPRKYWSSGRCPATCALAPARPASTRLTGAVSPWADLKLGVGYRVSSAQGPETTRHEAELHPITHGHYAACDRRAQRKRDVRRSEPYRADLRHRTENRLRDIGLTRGASITRHRADFRPSNRKHYATNLRGMARPNLRFF